MGVSFFVEPKVALANSLPTTNESNVPTKVNQLANFPLNFLRTGHYTDGKVYARTRGGGWWLDTRSSTTDANYLGTNPTDVLPQHNYPRESGFALRWGGLPTTNTSDVPAKANQLANFPLNFLRTGSYHYGGSVYYRTAEGNWWSTTGTSATPANALGTSVSLVSPQASSSRGLGFALRWGAE